MSAAAQRAAVPPTRRRRALVWGLIVLAAIVLLVASMTVWVRRQALDTDNWTNTSASLLQDEQVRSALAVYIVDQLYTTGNFENRLESRLPEALQGLAAPVAAALRGPAQSRVETFLGRPATETAWKALNRTAHQELIAILEGHPRDNVSTTGGDVVLDVRAFVVAAGSELGLGQQLDAALPPDAGQITILHSDQLKNAQRGVKAIKALSWVFGIVAFLLWAGAIWLAAGWRRVALRGIGISVLLVGLLLLFVRQAAGNYVVDALTDPGTTRDAGHRVWLLATTLLAQIGWAGVIYGIAILVGTTLAGPSRYAVATRSWLAPMVLGRVVLSWIVVAVLFLLLTWWGPTPTFHTWIGVLLLAALVAAGFEALRRQLAAEHPSLRRPAFG